MEAALKLLALFGLAAAALLGAWWALGAGDDRRAGDAALVPEEGHGGGKPRVDRSPVPVGGNARVAESASDPGTEETARDERPPPATEPAPAFAPRYDGWPGERMLGESRRMLAQLDLAAREAARPLLTGRDAEDDVGEVQDSTGIVVREKGRRIVLDRERFAALYAMRAEAVWVAQEGGRRIAREGD